MAESTEVHQPEWLENPCLGAYGPGPEGWRCGSCANVSAVHVGTRVGHRTIYYCCIDGEVKRVTWPACERFVLASYFRP